MKSKILGLLATGLLAGPMVAGATIISGTYEFTATGFLDQSNPIDPVVGTFSITFDNSADISDSTAGVTDGFVLHSTNFPAAPSGYAYFAENDWLTVGGLVTGVGAIDAGLDDWAIVIDDISSSPTGSIFGYSPIFAGELIGWLTFVVSVRRVEAVDEGSTFVLFTLGFAALLCMVMRHRVA